jgi:dihydrofolate reductase
VQSTCSVFVATSLDGYIARKDGSIDWLLQANRLMPAGEDCGYAKFFASVDALVMGRNSYEMVQSFTPWPYGGKRVVVLSRLNVPIPSELVRSVTSSSAEPVQVVTQLAAEGARHLYIDGGKTIQRFLRADLIDDITITVIPVLLGAGRPLFGPLSKDIHLKHLTTRSYEFGFVQHHYRVIR